ncbi:Secreted protein [Streptomyces venezuelae]|uniref:hypothetical protein n=1 Tax=Streptomyces gardneri TaxID=66892 RepID=UPI0006BC3587|nr:hypothetical protein [Streptomyces gardneri]ALO10728.1 Secreted protein [Streptomyces venezuelae]QPK47700.1 hypothetical protein H4W23_25755 [Streptomyces gardneri]WRK39146.1 hypothetical protein U0M97_25875 [Streptomyces venezuelae]CUM38787.1 Extensin-like protein precursor [Streptomyces venezuelae]
MRPLATRRITALAISAAITLGAAGPAVAGEHHPSSAADRAAHAPLPEAAALLTQAEALGDLGSVTTPVTELVTAALKADAGQLPAADADALKTKIAAAVEQAKETAPAPLPDTPAPDLPAPDLPSPDLPAPDLPSPDLPAPDLPAPDLPAPDLPAPDLPAPDLPAPDLPAPDLPAPDLPAPDLPVKPPVSLPVAAGAKAASAAPADVVDDALATVEKAVAGLLAAVTSGDAAGVVPQVTATLTSLVNLAVATVLGSGLPAPDLAGLPALPALPVAVPELPVDPPELPVDPPELPVDAPVKPPVGLPDLPVKPPLPVR